MTNIIAKVEKEREWCELKRARERESKSKVSQKEIEREREREGGIGDRNISDLLPLSIEKSHLLPLSIEKSDLVPFSIRTFILPCFVTIEGNLQRNSTYYRREENNKARISYCEGGFDIDGLHYRKDFRRGDGRGDGG